MNQIKNILNLDENNDLLLFSYYGSVNEAIKKLKLDKRHKWYDFMGELIRDGKCKLDCYDCYGNGCQTCGYKKQIWQFFPIPALDPLNGNPIKILKI